MFAPGIALAVAALVAVGLKLAETDAPAEDEPSPPAKSAKPPKAKPLAKKNRSPKAVPPEKPSQTATAADTNLPPPQKVGEVRDGYYKHWDGRLQKVTGVVTNSLAHRKGKYSIFRHSGENEIARLIYLQPGENLVGTPVYASYKKSLLMCLEEEIAIDPEDNPETVEVKNTVKEAKAALKAAHLRGEDIAQIMLDARKECQQLAQYKRVLTRGVLDAASEDASSLDSYLEAANKMLEEKGIAPLKLGPISRIKLQKERK